MNYEFEKKKLHSILGEKLLSALKGKSCYVAGGTITSLFCNREVNDIDIYFKSQDAFIDFLTEVWEERNGWIIASTDKATLIRINNCKEFQMIHFKFFPKAEDIFETFDFTVCMGAYDFEKEEFILHPQFMQHNSQRILKFNNKTAFPLVSLLRVQKYKEKGYSISKPEFIRIALTCMNLKIDTYEELKEQMGGMYGVNYDKLFKDKEGEVDLEEAVSILSDLVLDDDYFKVPDNIGTEMSDLDEFIDDICKREIPYFELNNQIYRIYNGEIVDSDNKPRYGVQKDPNEYLSGAKFYKFVEKVGGVYRSFYDKTFLYEIGKEAKAVKFKSGSYMMGNVPVLYFNQLKEISCSPYKNNKNTALLEVQIKDANDVHELSGSSVELKRCDVVREVPITEYEKYLKK